MCSLKPRSSMIHEYEKNVQIKHKKYGKGGHRNLLYYFEANFPV